VQRVRPKRNQRQYALAAAALATNKTPLGRLAASAFLHLLLLTANVCQLGLSVCLSLRAAPRLALTAAASAPLSSAAAAAAVLPLPSSLCCCCCLLLLLLLPPPLRTPPPVTSGPLPILRRPTMRRVRCTARRRTFERFAAFFSLIDLVIFRGYF
jgi:hypothetical protein